MGSLSGMFTNNSIFADLKVKGIFSWKGKKFLQERVTFSLCSDLFECVHVCTCFHKNRIHFVNIVLKSMWNSGSFFTALAILCDAFDYRVKTPHSVIVTRVYLYCKHLNTMKFATHIYSYSITYTCTWIQYICTCMKYSITVITVHMWFFEWSEWHVWRSNNN